MWALRRSFPAARSLLEVGCGDGNVLAAIAAANPALRVVGAEMHLAGLERARARAPAAELVQMDALDIAYREEFDVVCAFDLIEHVERDQAVLERMHAACRRGGGVMVTVPQHPWLWSGRDIAARHRRRYTRGELLHKLAAAGFTRPWTTSFVTLLLPLLYASRRARREADVPANAELRVGPAVNAVLGAILGVERALIRLGVRWPAGGSLLAVAHKP